MRKPTRHACRLRDGAARLVPTRILTLAGTPQHYPSGNEPPADLQDPGRPGPCAPHTLIHISASVAGIAPFGPDSKFLAWDLSIFASVTSTLLWSFAAPKGIILCISRQIRAGSLGSKRIRGGSEASEEEKL
jgi:hypothetical protein